MKKTTLLALLVVAAAPLTADVNRIVLRVNDHIVTLHDYQQRYSARLRSLQASNLPDAERAEALATLGESVFREMFDEQLLLSRASHLRVDVTEEMIESSMQRMREANGLTDNEDFETALAQAGMSRADLREQARRNILLQQVTARELQSRVELDEEDLRRYYQAHLEEFSVPRKLDLRSIVVLEASGQGEQERAALALEAAATLEAGIDHETWAEAHSAEGETTKVLELGWVAEGDLAPEIEAAVWPLGAGEVSEPIAARGGLHVVQVVAVEEAHLEPFSEVKERVRQLEMSRLQQEAVTKMLNDFEKASFVRIDPPPEAAGFRTSRGLPQSGLGALGTAEPATSTSEPPAADDGR